MRGMPQRGLQILMQLRQGFAHLLGMCPAGVRVVLLAPGPPPPCGHPDAIPVFIATRPCGFRYYLSPTCQGALPNLDLGGFHLTFGEAIMRNAR
jgi:hypothetical protein